MRRNLLVRAWNRGRRFLVGVPKELRSQVRNRVVRADNQARGGLPIPPSRLVHLVAGTDDVHWFLVSGARAAESVRSALEENGVPFENLKAILDFGCGVGRVIRHWSSLRGPKLYGTDYNADLIAWCQKNLPFADFRTNAFLGKLDYEEAKFDLIFALSVFTHLTENQQSQWMTELCRVLAPGGYLLFSAHGRWHIRDLRPEDQARFLDGELVVYGSKHAGANTCASFHPEKYVREILAKDWIVVDFIPEGALGNPHQDLYLLRKPGLANQVL